MKSKLLLILVFIFTISIYGQEYENGTIVTKHYDTISNVKIEKLSEAKSLLHINYIDEAGNEQSPDIETIKCYNRGVDIYCRIYNSGEMILAKKVVNGEKLNLYERNINGSTTYYIEKVYDELIKVPSSSNKFKKVIGSFLSDAPQISSKIESKQLVDIMEIVNLYNKG
ncbi:hypothetical protein BX611_2383 [Lutibacter oceani]|uniref:Uncharacterized protein n=1 Tax=Lutibacter oceani TaxID=1853311 RepID=A0A3D9RLG6_9FLAO|nr:hypothetical protein [Lutibacter oceani]REE80730.1 hypothetical protein BX611_2383 [Lutibacter oceani]